MSVWFVLPSKRPLSECAEVFGAWRKQGYSIAVCREVQDGVPPEATICLPVHDYLGWARSVNMLVANVMAIDEKAEWLVTGGDDYWPDLNYTADEIALQCRLEFASRRYQGALGIDDGDVVNALVTCLTLAADFSTFGVMQPTGDRWQEKNGEATIDRIAGSPWMGREFCRRMYQGSGPMYNGYYHNFADEELQNVAQKLGVFWQRRDLIHEHRHWARPRGDWADAPAWAHRINRPDLSDWNKSKALFAARKSAGFPGHEPLEL